LWLVARTPQHGQAGILGKIRISRRPLAHEEDGTAIGLQLPHPAAMRTEPNLRRGSRLLTHIGSIAGL